MSLSSATGQRVLSKDPGVFLKKTNKLKGKNKGSPKLSSTGGWGGRWEAIPFFTYHVKREIQKTTFPPSSPLNALLLHSLLLSAKWPVPVSIP